MVKSIKRSASKKSSSWTRFLKKHGGQGLTLQQISKLYAASKKSVSKKPRKRVLKKSTKPKKKM